MSSVFWLPLVLALFSCIVWLASALSVVLVVCAIGAATVDLIHRTAPEYRAHMDWRARRTALGRPRGRKRSRHSRLPPAPPARCGAGRPSSCAGSHGPGAPGSYLEKCSYVSPGMKTYLTL